MPILVLSGAAVLVIEIVGAKLLSPYFGNSHFVWTNQILTTLLALSLGAHAGGRIADGGGAAAWAPRALTLAGWWLFLMFPVFEKANYFFLRFQVGPGAILAAFFLYFTPLTLLGTVPPMAASRMATTLGEGGRASARAMAGATVGSLIGCLLAGLILIPSFVNEFSLLATGGALAVGGIIGELRLSSGRRFRVGIAVGSIVLGSVGLFGYQQLLKPRLGLGREVARHDSGHSLLLVMEDEEAGHRDLVDDFVLLNCYDPQSGESCASFTHALQSLALAYVEAPENVLCIGLGAGVVPMRFAETDAAVDAVEIHPGIIEMAETWFDFDPSRVRVWLEDGRGFLRRRHKDYDVVLFDAFSGDSSPSHLLTREAFRDARKALREDGVLVVNCITSTEPGQDYLIASVQRTLSIEFPNVRVHFSHGGNVFLVASGAPLTANAERGLATCGEAFRERVAETLANFETALRGGGDVLTDDRNAVEFRDAGWRAKERGKLAWIMYRK